MDYCRILHAPSCYPFPHRTRISTWQTKWPNFGIERRASEALTTVHHTGERWWEAELYRLKGELSLCMSDPSGALSAAEECFRQALDIARRQQAKSLELRAAMSLSRLWKRQGKRAAAHELLAPIYGWFTEGFDTADLQEAKALLEELAR